MAKKKKTGAGANPASVVNGVIQQVFGLNDLKSEEELRDEVQILKGLISPIIGGLDADYIEVKRYNGNTDVVVYLQEEFGKFTLMKIADAIINFFDKNDYIMIKMVFYENTKFIRVRNRDGQIRDTFDLDL